LRPVGLGPVFAAEKGKPETEENMQAYPHRYLVDASTQPAGSVVLSAAGLSPLHTAPPAEFGGPGDQWSPETLLVGAVADCFVLTFRAIATASRFPWTALRCSAEGQLDRVEGVTRFTRLALRARLTVPPGSDREKAKRLLEKAEKSCLITNSLALASELTCEVDSEAAEGEAASVMVGGEERAEGC
jgi:peroxiredoxin-like protein